MRLKVLVDWDRDFSFASDYDDISADVIDCSFSNGIGRAFQLMADEAICKLQLRNNTGKYTPENTASPIYGKIKPQTPIRIILVDNDGNEVIVWRGWIDTVQVDWTPSGKQTARKTVQMECVGAKIRLDQYEPVIELQENRRTDQIIERILGTGIVLPPAFIAGWLLGVTGFSELGVTTYLASTSDFLELDTGYLTLEFFGDLKEGNSRTDSAYGMIRDVVDAERGRFFFRRDGKAVFWNRDRVLDYLPPIATINSDGSYAANGLAYSYGQNITTSVTATIFQRKEDATTNLWTLDSTLTIIPFETKTLEILFTDDNGKQVGAKNVSIATETYSAGTATATIETKSDRATVSIENSGTIDAVLSALVIEGNPIRRDNKIVIRREDTAAIQEFAKRGDPNLQLKAISQLLDGEEIADLELLRLKDVRGQVNSISYINPFDGIRNAHQFEWEIGDFVRVELDELGHAQDYVIIGEQHHIYQGMKAHDTTFILEPLTIQRIAYYPRTSQDDEIDLKNSGDSPVKQKLAMNFESPYANTISKIRLWMRKEGAPTGTLNVKIYETNEPDNPWLLGISLLGVDTYLGAETPEPDTLLGTSEDVSAAVDVDSGYSWVEFRFSTPVSITEGIAHSLVLETSDSASGMDYIVWGMDGSSPSYTDGEMLFWDGTFWDQVNADACFEVFK